MALDTVVFPQDPFTYNGGKDLYNLLGLNWNNNYDFSLGKEDDDQSLNFLGNQTEVTNYGEWSSTSSTPNSMLPHFNEVLHLSNINPPSSDNNIMATTNDSSESSQHHQQQQFESSTSAAAAAARPKRRRSKSRKNKEEIENQRMTHIAVERNRRKQMNEYLAVLRSLMPDSYVQRGDQASIIGGAINFVKELEQQVQFLGAQKEINDNSDGGCGGGSVCRSMPFSEFFTFPQYSTSSTHCENSVAMVEAIGENKSAIADVEVTMVESHANLKIRSKRRSKQLLKIVSGLHTLRLSILHLNVTTADESALYSLSVKVEDDCKLNSVDEIAGAVYQMLARIQEEEMLNN